MKKITNIITIALFFTVILSVFLINIILPDLEISKWERRKLTQFPEVTVETVMNGKFFSEFQKYSDDQFLLRDNFRVVNSFVRRNVLLLRDVNGLYIEKGYIFSMDEELNEKSVNNFVKKTNEIIETYLGDAKNIYLSVVPDKTHFSEEARPKADALKIAELYSKGVEKAEYIDIFPGLSLESYYKTDSHWSQDKLKPVMEIFKNEMGMVSLPDFENVKTAGEFYGVYYGQLASDIPMEEMKYVFVEGKVTENLEPKGSDKIYDSEKFNNVDPYDLFMQGATPIIKAVNENSATEDELIIFRDSFGSSISPLFLSNYRSVTLIDLRYLNSSLMKEYVEFENKDVLFLYSSSILNSNIILK